MSIREVFDSSAESYDSGRRQLIPCYDDFYTVPLDILPFNPERELRVLDLGAGTGLFSAGVAARYKRAHLTLIDVSRAMLQIAEKRFAGVDARRVTLQVADYGKEPLKGTYDLVISALSIHHLVDTDKAKLFRRIFAILEPGGIFVNADQVQGENLVAEKLYQQIWRKKVESSGISPTALAAALARMQEDRMSPLSHQLEWLVAAGFCDTTTWYQYYSFVVYSGTKPLVHTTR